MTDDRPHILIAGNPEEFHVGSHFQRAAHSLGWYVSFCDVRAAYGGSRWARALLWKCGHRLLRLAHFSKDIVAGCWRDKPTFLLTTGLAPLRSQELAEIRALGIATVNFLTDDPWNPLHYAGWFQKSLREYDHVFSPRRENLNDLRDHGCKQVHYLPFAYSPDVHFPENPDSSSIDAADVIFIGAADADRLPYVRALPYAGLKTTLYGGYWGLYRDLKPYWRGHADLTTIRQATKAAKIVLCLVRHANRDGHAMRSFEVPAMQGCMLAEDTPDHQEMFGSDGEAVIYFRSVSEMVDRARWLLENEAERRRLALAAYHRITAGRNTYADRLGTMLQTAGLKHAALVLR